MCHQEVGEREVSQRQIQGWRVREREREMRMYSVVRTRPHACMQCGHGGVFRSASTQHKGTARLPIGIYRRNDAQKPKGVLIRGYCFATQRETQKERNALLTPMLAAWASQSG